MKLKRIISWIFFPERCSICGEIKPFLKSYCPECEIDTKIISPDACQICGSEKCICIHGVSSALNHFTAVYHYEGQVKNSILKFKFSSDSSYADIFGKAMADRIRQVYGSTDFDCVCFVPMTQQAEYHRGYNQSELLALKVAQELNLPLAPCLKKTQDTLYQKELSAEARLNNVKDSFEISENTLSQIKLLSYAMISKPQVPHSKSAVTPF